jgi:enoyl-CoA hydratase/carnithine racemase
VAEEIVRVERDGDVALIVLNRPEARNAMNVALAAATCDAIRASQDAAAIVITGVDPASCAGLDLRSLGTERPCSSGRASRGGRKSERALGAGCPGEQRAGPERPGAQRQERTSVSERWEPGIPASRERGLSGPMRSVRSGQA